MRFADLLRGLSREIRVVGLPLWNHFCTAFDPQSDNPFERIVYRKPEQGALDKVALFRYDKDFVIGQGNHVITSQGNPCAPASAFLPAFDTSPIAAGRTSFERFAMVPPPTPQPTCPSNGWPLETRPAKSSDEKGEEGVRFVFEKWFYFENPGISRLGPRPGTVLQAARLTN